jgi:hypothetical protein
MRRPSEAPRTFFAALSRIVLGPLEVQETCYCVDNQSRIVPEVNCQHSALGTSYRWVYGGTSEGQVGDIVVGGSAAPTQWAPGSRGGFGALGGKGAGG